MTKKFSKSEVEFEHPAKGSHHCGECKHFEGEDRGCAIVAGKVESGDWCKKFDPLPRIAREKY